MIMTKGTKQPKIKIAKQVPDKGILKVKAAQKANAKKEVKIHDESSENAGQSEYSSDLNIDDDSYEEKSKQSSVQALSGDEDIDELYEQILTKKQNEKGKGKNKHLAGASSGKDSRKDGGESSILDMFKQQRGSTRNKS